MPYTPIPSGTLGNIPADQLPSVEQWLNQSGLTMGTPTATAPSTTPFSNVFGDQTGAYLGDALKGLQKFLDPFGTGKSPAQNATTSLENTAVSYFANGQFIAVVMGIVLIIAGLFLLKNGPIVKIVTKTAKDVAVGG